MPSAFTYEVRLLACGGCGAPTEVPTGGGSSRCRFCGVTAVWGPRAQVSDTEALRNAPPTDEYERFQRLKEQEGKLLLPPESLAHLLVGGTLPLQLVPEALATWQATLREVVPGAPPGVHERLFFLTLMLVDALPDGDPRRRAVVETAIETLPAAQHRHQLRGSLAREAVRARDLESAAAWLSGCDGRSWDLAVDTNYRATSALIATARGDFAEVLRVLGRRAEDVPIAASSTAVAAVIRANALERTGAIAEAEAALLAGIGGDFHRLPAVRAIRAKNASLELCPKTAAALEARAPKPPPDRDEQLAAAIDAAMRTSTPMSMMTIGLPFGVIGAGLVIGGFLVDPASRTDDNLLPANWFLWGIGAVFLGVSALPLLIRRMTARATQGLVSPRRHVVWRPAMGQILSARPTGATTNDLPDVALRLRVFYETLAPYEASLEVSVPHHQVASLSANTSISLLVDASNPQNVRAG